MALLGALRKAFDDRVDVFSVAPLLDFPHSRILVAPNAKWKIDHSINATMASFINLPGIKHITRFIATFVFVTLWSHKNRKKERVIILHGLQSCKIWGVLVGQIFAPSLIIPFLTDDIGIPTKWEKPLLKKFRIIDIYLMKLGIKRVSGVIAMTSNLSHKLAPGHQHLIIPAIMNTESITINSKSRNDNYFNIVYAGGLFQNYGLTLLINAFNLANRDNWRLIIAGKGDMERKIFEFVRQNKNINYMGFLNTEEICNLYEKADVFVNPRLLFENISEFSFPSKIVEYLSTGKPVISTNLPVFDDGFRDHLIISKSDSPRELIQCLEEVSSWDDHQRELWRKKSLEFVNTNLSPVTQGLQIRNFVNVLQNSR
ncbi:MAG: glycosyltransferase family 4 protein [Anaerolineaceae bacterium]|nr:glycosyltransferase family 4 protein [Anaerolineaceae bacterium]